MRGHALQHRCCRVIEIQFGRNLHEAIGGRGRIFGLAALCPAVCDPITHGYLLDFTADFRNYAGRLLSRSEWQRAWISSLPKIYVDEIYSGRLDFDQRFIRLWDKR